MIRRNTHRAFTLIELLLVLVILSVLAAVVVPKFTNQAAKAKVKATIADISNLKTALDTFEVECGRYPTTEEGLEALVSAPPALANVWEGRKIDKVPVDKWGNNYQYICPGVQDPESYDLKSFGPDGQDGTSDDIDKNTQG